MRICACAGFDCLDLDQAEWRVWRSGNEGHNVLRDERDGTVKRIVVKPGDTLAFDAVIMEFA
jgi:hypothetical protein